MDLDDQLIPKGEIPGQTDEFCRIYMLLHSPGIWDLKGSQGFLDYTLPRLLLQLALMFLLTQSLHLLLRRIYLPRIVSEILAGLILGKSFLGGLIPQFTETLFPEDGEIFLDALSKIGFILFMFLAGVKMSTSMIFKNGIKSFFIGVSVSTITIYSATQISKRIDNEQPFYRRPSTRSVLGVITITPFPVIASLLIDLKIMNSELGRLALASTLISDVIGTLFQSGVATVILSYLVGWNSIAVVSGILGFLLCASIVSITHPVSLWIIKRTPEGKPVKVVYIAFVVSAVMVTALLCDNVGMQYHFGPFLLGLCVPDGPPLGSTLVERLDTLVSGLLAPLLVTHCSMKTDVLLVYDFKYMGFLWTVISGISVVKFIAVFFPALLCLVPIRDALALSFIMASQGIVEMALYDNVFRNQTLDDFTFSTVILSVLLIAAITYNLVRLIYDYSRTYRGYQKRNILHTAYNAELRVLACAHRPDDALAAIKLLEVSNPSRESPIAAFALNLVELVGRATPLLINHRFGQKVSSGGSRSQQIINVFQHFQKQYSGMVNVQVFTAMSLPKFMHHDVCSLAFDKTISLIILPFHRKWNQQGKLIFDNNILRTMNQEVLDMAPCSVGILMDRRKIRNESSVNLLAGQSVYQVVVIFLGGEDDREALAYGKRMAESSAVHLTVVRLMAWDDAGENQWDTVLDTEALKVMKVQSAHRSNIIYREVKVKDGPETALIINAMEEAFDLIMVGRHHREDSPLLSGLTEWTDLPELGPIGDMLASSDIKKPVSIMVVQQQLLKNK